MPKEKYVQKVCKTHGLTKFVLEWRGYYRCAKCRMAAVAKRRKDIKRMSVEYKGGKCQKCGYNKCIHALEFHHLYGKDFALASKGYTRSWEKVKIELDKCQLLCANCHREVHTDE